MLNIIKGTIGVEPRAKSQAVASGVEELRKADKVVLSDIIKQEELLLCSTGNQFARNGGGCSRRKGYYRMMKGGLNFRSCGKACRGHVSLKVLNYLIFISSEHCSCRKQRLYGLERGMEKEREEKRREEEGYLPSSSNKDEKRKEEKRRRQG